jgi:signal transduction histidine kinase
MLRSILRADLQKPVFRWIVIGVPFVLCGVLAVLQYRWVGEVSNAERDRLRGSLQASLNRLAAEFNSELTAAARALMPSGPEIDLQTAQSDVAGRYDQWKRAGRPAIFRQIGIGSFENGTTTFYKLDLQNVVFEKAEWPQAWVSLKQRMEAGPGPFRRPEDGLVFELPIVAMQAGEPPSARRTSSRLFIEFDQQHLCETMLPELVNRYLFASGSKDYQFQVLTNPEQPTVVYPAGPGVTPFNRSADATVPILELRYEQIMRPFAQGMRMRGRDGDFGKRRSFEKRLPPPDDGRQAPGEPSGRGFQSRGGRGPGGPEFGRWHLAVRHRSGSLEAAVAKARWRNLAVTGGVLLLMMASVAMLIRYTRRAQKLAELQMNFVAGVSHELRTPLTVINTAAYNLRGKIAENPTQVARYGEVIQQESGRLKELVEQVLRFASATAGRVIQNPEPLSIENLINETLESSRSILQGAHCAIEKKIEPDLPFVEGDPLALKHAIQNLLSNAAKYGATKDPWIGLSVSRAAVADRPEVEIRVSDRGPGIPEEEQEHIFDPFFRGRRALEDQIHGAGLGLNLVKKIVEAHGGSIRVKSGPTDGTEFIVRIPALAT